MAGANFLDAIEHMPGNFCANVDATGTYTQSTMAGDGHVAMWIAFLRKFDRFLVQSWRK